jgi:predicted amidohydrolase YtcJ
MSEVTRGEFLGYGAAALAALGTAGCAPGGGSGPDEAKADQVVTNANVLTMDTGQPAAQAFAVKNGRFIAVGATDDIMNLAGPNTEVIDAGGATVTPGFIDAHSHPAWGGLDALVSVDTNLGSVAAIKDVLAARAAQTPPGEWVIGYMYDDTKLSEGRPLNRADLDEAVPNNPAYVGHRGGHTGVVNSAAFRVAGITMATPDPQGGQIYREGGELTGKLAENALFMVAEHLPDVSSREQRQAAIKRIGELMNQTGLTSVHETGSPGVMIRAYQDAHVASELSFRAFVMPDAPTYPGMRDAGLMTGLGSDMLKIGAVKFVADGSASERTMRMSTPYMGRPDDYGILTMSQAEIHEAVEDAHRAGWQVAIHANGDVTIDMVLNAYERVQEMWPRDDPRHRIEHCSLVNPSLLERIAGVGAVPAPFYTYAHYHGNKWVEYGEEKMEWMFAHKSFIDYGIHVAPASDWTPGPFEPLMAIQSMVTRKDFAGRVWGPSQRITVDQALQVCTMNGAYASHEESDKGSITAGKLADWVMLGADPHDVDPDGIKEIEVRRTVLGGVTKWEA